MLTVRVVQATVSLAINMVAVKFFPLTLVSMIVNMTPVIAVVMGLLCLGETITCRETVLLLCTFSAVIMVVAGGAAGLAVDQQVVWWAWVMLLMNPVFEAQG